MIDEANKREGARLLRHDLREPLSEDGFDAAYNVFSSIGYADEAGDRAVFRTVHAALRAGGKFLVETRHRDDVVLEVHKGLRPAGKFADGTVMFEELAFDPVTGRVDTAWHYSGPDGSGTKPASWRVYSVTELIGLLASCGFRLISAHAGLSTEPFGKSVPYPRRVALLCERA
jgi:SAM-dependent methyltransferase